MAMAVDGEYVHANISLGNIVRELTSWQCNSFSVESETTAFVRNCLESYKKALDETEPHERAYTNLKADISSFISSLLIGKNTGKVTGG